MSDISAAYPAGCRRLRKQRSHELRVVSMLRHDELRDFPATDQAIRAGTPFQPHAQLAQQTRPSMARASSDGGTVDDG